METKIFIEVSQREFDRLQAKGMIKTDPAGRTTARINPSFEDYVPIKLKGEPDPVINYGTGLNSGFRETTQAIHACKEKAFGNRD